MKTRALFRVLTLITGIRYMQKVAADPSAGGGRAVAAAAAASTASSAAAANAAQSPGGDTKPHATSYEGFADAPVLQHHQQEHGLKPYRQDHHLPPSEPDLFVQYPKLQQQEQGDSQQEQALEDSEQEPQPTCSSASSADDSNDTWVPDPQVYVASSGGPESSSDSHATAATQLAAAVEYTGEDNSTFEPRLYSSSLHTRQQQQLLQWLDREEQQDVQQQQQQFTPAQPWDAYRGQQQ